MEDNEMVKLMFVFISLLSVIPCQAEVIVYFPMDSDPNWTTEGQWEFGVPQGGGGPESYDPTSGYTGSNVYGYNLAGNYENNIPEYRLTTSALNCVLAENVALSFWRWLGVESSLFDHAKIQVSNNGTNWTDVWVNGEDNLADTSWVYCEYDISAVADRQPTVFIRWCMGPTDFSMAYAGWNIDDVCLHGDVFDALFISPSDSFLSVGLAGGPFEPSCKTYTLTNEDTSPLSWTAEGTQKWLNVSPSGGTLSPGASVAVEMCMNSTATTLTEGRYTDTVRFTNTNSGFSYSIDVTLNVHFYIIVGDEVIVPLHFPTIQAAINASFDGDTIVVLDGSYSGTGNRDIDFKGRAITLKSANGPENCIIDCEGSSQYPHRGFYFHNGEGSQSIVDGFTVTRGYTVSYGGGIYCNNCSPTIRNCIINLNRATSGGGMYNNQSNPILTNCTFSGNRSAEGAGMTNVYSEPILINCTFSQNSGVGEGIISGGGMLNINGNPTLINCVFDRNLIIGTHAGHGGGMYNRGGNPTLTNCIFTLNSAIGGEYTAYAGGMLNRQGNPRLTNCIFCGNSTNDYCGGIYNSDGKPMLTNCILWDNSDIDGVGEFAQICTSGVGGPFINYSCIQGLDTFAGQGNIGEDPCFADSSNDDYHLKSMAGRWDPTSESWIKDEVSSPCVDTGDPNSDLRGELWPHGKRINMGAYGGTPQASMSLLDVGNIADLNNDDSADYVDVMLFTDKWLCHNFLLSEDLNRDGLVNFIDFSIFAYNWGPPTPPPGQAGNPNPADGAKDVNALTDLSWTAGSHAARHDVYFGTSSPPPFIGNQSYTTFDTGIMAYDTTYYWRIDEINKTGITVGAIWSFTTMSPLKAWNPNPADGAIWVSTTISLSWAAGVDATSHDVYFGTSDPPPFTGNQADTTFDPGTMDYSTKYYWRIDEVNSSGKTTGTVWSFWTMISPPP
jgi:hypothetical protein